MNTLYLLSGPTRVGKSTIMRELVAQTGVQLIAADALEHGLRNVLIGDPHQMLRGIRLQGEAEHKISFTDVGDWRPFENNSPESELLLEFIIGTLDYYRRNKESVAFEGTEFSPAWVTRLKIPAFEIKVAYVGYTDAHHVEQVLLHAQGNDYDWINDWLENENGDETKIRAWAQKIADKCKELKIDAETHGFKFFDISTQPFDVYKKAVLNHLIES